MQGSHTTPWSSWCSFRLTYPSVECCSTLDGVEVFVQSCFHEDLVEVFPCLLRHFALYNVSGHVIMNAWCKANSNRLGQQGICACCIPNVRSLFLSSFLVGRAFPIWVFMTVYLLGVSFLLFLLCDTNCVGSLLQRSVSHYWFFVNVGIRTIHTDGLVSSYQAL